MALELRTQRNGKLRENWYGVYTDETGTRRVVNLNVKWTGTPPATGKVADEGNQSFERSRERAEAALTAFVEESRRKGRAEHLQERLIESKTGEKAQYARIDELSRHWRALGRDTDPSERYLQSCDAHFKRFADFMAERNPVAENLYQVTKEDAAAFRVHCRSILSPATARYNVRLIKKACAYFLPVGCKNPFSAAIAKAASGDSGVIHRKPLEAAELRHLLDLAAGDPFLHGLVVAAALTGMRRSDVCGMRWESVSLNTDTLEVRTGKTGTKVSIPIWKPLRDILAAQGPKAKGFVFPEAARMLAENPNGLTYRMKQLFARAFTKSDAPALPVPAAADLEKDAVTAITAKVPEGDRRTRLIEVIHRYAAGEGLPTIAKALNVSKSTVHLDLHGIEESIGKRFMRSRVEKTDTKAAVAELTRVQRKNGQRAASIYDWHCLRTSWITLALANGVPETTVRAVTGHSTVDIVLEYYFKPNKAQLRAALAKALPDVLTGGAGKTKKTAADELADLAAKVQAKTATNTDKKRLRELVSQI